LSGGYRKGKVVFVPKMGYKGGNTFKGLEAVNQVTDTFRYTPYEKVRPGTRVPTPKMMLFLSV